jgi:hypothetical protein
MRRSLGGLRRPILLTGSKSDLGNLWVAEELTVKAFDRGEMSPGQFEREIELIYALIELSSDMLDSSSKIDIKEFEKRRKKEE